MYLHTPLLFSSFLVYGERKDVFFYVCYDAECETPEIGNRDSKKKKLECVK